MIVVDSSALIAIVLGEADASSCRAVIAVEADLLIAAPTLAEVLIVAARHGVRERMQTLIDGLAMTVVPLTQSRADQAVDAYERWGKGFDQAKLNFGDAFAYALAKEYGCALLFVGDDFGRTDVISAVA